MSLGRQEVCDLKSGPNPQGLSILVLKIRLIQNRL